MNTVLIAGAGQLGSRHLQGVKTSTHELDIWVYDLSEDSLKVAEERYNQVESQNKTVHYVTSLDLVPTVLDVVIVASSSKPRYAIVTQLLAKHSVRYLVLEKFLFPRLNDYSEIKDLLKEKNVTAWVNCPRRMWDGYIYIRSLIDQTKPVEYTFEGGEWGMCCNTIHFVDIFMMLNGQKNVSVNIDNLTPYVVDSKRAGYVEVHGTEVFTTQNKSVLKLTSSPDYKNTIRCIIKNGNKTIEYYEGTGEIFVNGESKCVPIHYQSGLSGILVDEMLTSGTCRLTSYEESASYHVAYLSKIAPFINKIKGWTSDSCPIT